MEIVREVDWFGMMHSKQVIKPTRLSYKEVEGRTVIKIVPDQYLEHLNTLGFWEGVRSYLKYLKSGGDHFCPGAYGDKLNVQFLSVEPDGLASMYRYKGPNDGRYPGTSQPITVEEMRRGVSDHRRRFNGTRITVRLVD